jgi:hypothetical protein
MKQGVLAVLRERASELGAEATVLDFACQYVANGGRITTLAAELGVTRPFLSGVLNTLSDDASERLEAARAESAATLVEEAAQIADDAEPFPASVAKAGLQVKTRHWMAERFAPDKFGVKGSTINVINAGQLMLDALRRPPPARALPAADSDELGTA